MSTTSKENTKQLGYNGGYHQNTKRQPIKTTMYHYTTPRPTSEIQTRTQYPPLETTQKAGYNKNPVDLIRNPIFFYPVDEIREDDLYRAASRLKLPMDYLPFPLPTSQPGIRFQDEAHAVLPTQMTNRKAKADTIKRTPLVPQPYPNGPGTFYNIDHQGAKTTETYLSSNKLTYKEAALPTTLKYEPYSTTSTPKGQATGTFNTFHNSEYIDAEVS